jgi:hypothetical protein
MSEGENEEIESPPLGAKVEETQATVVPVRHAPTVITDEFIAEEVYVPKEGAFYLRKRFDSEEINRIERSRRTG